MEHFLFLLIGLAVFLYGMSQLELGIRAVGSEQLTLRLRQSTGTPVSGVLSGVVLTAILQSSSMVSLLMMAFVGAGTISLANGISVVLGANLGTTFTGWIVTTVGFKVDLTALALPVIGLGSAWFLMFIQRGKRVQGFGVMLIGLGLLLLGLSTMKDSVDRLPAMMDLSLLQDLNPWVFLLVGLVFAAVVQSSSAVMMVTLTTLNAGLIDLHQAAAIVIGADLGTTSTTALGSITGAAVKRQLALAHIIFNLLVDFSAAVFLLPWIEQLKAWSGINDPLYALVAFHSLFNALGLIIFLPVIPRFAKWLSRLFLKENGIRLKHIAQVPVTVVPNALEAMDKDIAELQLKVLALNMRNLRLDPNSLKLPSRNLDIIDHQFDTATQFEESYTAIKQMEGELIRYALDIQQQPLTEEQSHQLSRLLNNARFTVLSAKSLKDIRENLVALRTSQLALMREQYQAFLKAQRHFYSHCVRLVLEPETERTRQELIVGLKQSNDQIYQGFSYQILSTPEARGLSETDASTFLNAVREIWVSNQYLADSL